MTPDWAAASEPLSAKAGMHRFVWDLRYTLPKELVPPRGSMRAAPPGPWAPPGRYTVRLTAAGKTLTRPLLVVKDPRLGPSVTDADLVRQLDLAREIEAERVRAALALAGVEALRKQVAALRAKKEGAPSVPGALDAFTGAVDAAAGPPLPYEEYWDIDEIPQNTLRRAASSLAHLESAVQSADAAPTPDALTGLAERKKLLGDALARWRGVLADDLPKLNGSLTAAGIPPLVTE